MDVVLVGAKPASLVRVVSTIPAWLIRSGVSRTGQVTRAQAAAVPDTVPGKPRSNVDRQAGVPPTRIVVAAGEGGSGA